MNVAGNSTGFANLWIVIFFMLSGYGVQYSLARHLQQKKYILKNLIKFYYLRFVRIFPLFWMAYLAECFVFNQKVSLLVLFGVHGTGHYWFIPAIIQCYIIAPIIFLIVRRNRIMAFNFIFLTFIAINFVLKSNVTPSDLIKLLNFIHLYWRNVPFLYLFIFSLSMLLPEYIGSWSKVSSAEKKYYFYIFIFLVMILMISSRFRSNMTYLYNISNHTISPLLIIALTLIYSIINNIKIKFVSQIGKISYPIYLFHMIMYRLINKAFGFGVNSSVELFIYLMCFPLFFYFCYHLDNLSRILAIFQKNINRKPNNNIPLGERNQASHIE